MRLILGFIFFGLLFYAIYLYFPEAFHTLQDWAAKIFGFFQNLFQDVSQRFSDHPAPSTSYPR